MKKLLPLTRYLFQTIHGMLDLVANHYKDQGITLGQTALRIYGRMAMGSYI